MSDHLIDDPFERRFRPPVFSSYTDQRVPLWQTSKYPTTKLMYAVKPTGFNRFAAVIHRADEGNDVVLRDGLTEQLAERFLRDYIESIRAKHR